MPETAQQKPGNQGTCLRPEKPQCGSLQKTYAALSGEYENFANKLNGESCREAKTDGSRGTTESFNGACLFLCSTIAAALAEYKNSLVFEVLYIQAERRKDQTLLHVTGYAQGEHNNDTPSLLAQPPRPVTKTPAMLDEQLFAELHLSPLVLSSPEEVQRSFFRKRNQPPEEKYMQYLAIPVLSKRNEIIGLIEIVVKKIRSFRPSPCWKLMNWPTLNHGCTI